MFALRDAVSFLTRIPAHRHSANGSDMSAAVPWFPVVGLALGLLQAAIYLGLLKLLPSLPASAVVVALLCLVTGAFHHDGLADMADAFGGGWTVEQRLEILKDSRLGTYGVTALCLVLIVEVSAISSLSGWPAVYAMASAHTLSRAMSTVAMVTSTPARDSGLGVDYLTGLNSKAVVVAGVFATVVVAVGFKVWAIVIVAGAGAVTLAVVRLAISKIGGISGDVLGGIQQLTKLATLLIALAIVRNAEI